MPILSAILRLTLLVLIPIGVVHASTSPSIDSDEKTAIVTAVASVMTEKYVDADLGPEMAQHVLALQEKGVYEKFVDIRSFCSALTADLRSVSNDKHLFVFHSPEEARMVAALQNKLPEDEIEEVRRLDLEGQRRENFGFQRVEILDGNVGYLKLDYFPSDATGAETAVAAMAFLANSEAIIIDLTENGGGEGLVPFLASYFFPPGEFEMTGVYTRESDSVTRYWTELYVPGRRLPEVDVFVLTSSRTFSAAEDFAYSLQQLKRATVVGERSKGGAHPVDILNVGPNVLTQVSIGKSINPISNTNWEGVGVQPDIPVPAETALRTAHSRALEGLLNGAADDERIKYLEELITEIGRAK